MISSIIKKIKARLPSRPIRKYLHEPVLNNKTLHHIEKCLDSTYVSTEGFYIDKLSDEIKKVTNSRYILLTNTGTSALHMALYVMNLDNTEVLVPSMTFVATVNTIRYVNAIPHFIDSGSENINIDYHKLDKYLEENTYMKSNSCINKKTNNKIKCLIVVHAYGYPANIINLKKISKKYNIEIIEDAAGALGSYHKEKHVGTFTRFGIISFNGNKIVTTGMGGALLINNKNDYIKIKHYISTSRLKHEWIISHNDIGYNYRMANINAALGYSQILKISQTIKMKKRLHIKYCKAFRNNKYATIYHVNKTDSPNYWLNNLILDDEYINKQASLIKSLHSKNIFARYLWTPQHLLSMHKKYPSMRNNNAINHWKKTISLPSSYINEIN